MQHPPPGHFRSAELFRQHLQQIGAGFDLDDHLEAAGPLTQALPQPLFGRQVDNRFAIHPMEGWDGTPDGGPSAHTLRRWRRFGHSGAGVICGGEAFAVQADGRANPHQLHLGPASEAHLAALLGELRAGSAEAGGGTPLVGLQLTHSGRFARPQGPFAPLTTHRHALLERKYAHAGPGHLLSDGELEAIGANYVRAAVLAARAGFDFVDVKCCHGYLLHELLASKTRPGPYGGSLANRMRLFERIVAGIRSEAPGLGIAVRLSAGDTVPFERHPETGLGVPMQAPGLVAAEYHFGLAATDPTACDLAEPLQFLQRCQQLGIPLANITLGSPYWNPHLQRPAAYPPSDGYLPPHDPLLLVGRHLAVTRALRQACPQLVLVGTGYTYLQEWLPHTAQRQLRAGHVQLVGLGRMVLSYPELPRDLVAGRPLQRKRICRTFSDCTTAPRNGMLSGCFPLDPYYKAMPEAARVKQLQQESRS